MVDKNRVILMTRMASYENGKGRDDLRVGRYFRGDYVAIALMKAVFAAVVSGLLVMAIYVYYNYETFMEEIYEMDILGILQNFGQIFLKFTIGYVIFAYVICMVRFLLSRHNIRKYKRNLRKLYKLEKARDKENEKITRN